jgi:hypothetical protein
LRTAFRFFWDAALHQSISAFGTDIVMTTHQALQLGLALVSWSEGKALEVRNALAADKNWHPFTIDSYETINVQEGIEWRTTDRSLPVISKYDPQPARVKSKVLLKG